MAPGASAVAQTSAATRALFQDGTWTLHWRSHYLDRDRPGPVTNLAWAGGGWIGYRSGWLDERWRLGFTAYGSQKLQGPPGQDGTSLLLPGQRSYGVLGEAHGAWRSSGQTLTLGRFLIDEFEVNPQDTRMTPRTVEGLSLTGRLAGVDYFAGQLQSMKPRNADDFIDMATLAGAPSEVSAPLWLVSARATPRENLTLGAANYLVPDILRSTYTEASWSRPLDSDTRLGLGGQFLHQSSTGANLLTGTDFHTWTLGLRLDLTRGPLKLSGIVMETGRGAAYRTPYGSWRGYASRIINNFNRAGERVQALDVAIDFKTLGLPGLTLNGSATWGDAAIQPDTGAPLSRSGEYDLTLDYRFTAPIWPSWARSLWLRARAARFEQAYDDHTDITREFHWILNYELSLP